MAQVYIGTSGFYYRHWLGKFYPKNIKHDQLLAFYSKYFNTVEINSTFYRLPLEKTVAGWKKTVGNQFVFSLKMSRYVTQFGALSPEVSSLKLFFERVVPLASSPPRHLVLFQTSPPLKFNENKLKNLLEKLPNNFRYSFEFRHQSWFNEKTYQILKQAGAALVFADSPIKNNSRIFPKADVETANFFYFRFHGSQSLYSSFYTDKELQFYAELIKKKLKKGIDVYAYFNNDVEGYAIVNALRLKKLVSA